jgi:hypothetical protein
VAGLTYDSGALIGAERGDRQFWSLHARALGRGVIPVVPAGVLAEVWRGGPPEIDTVDATVVEATVVESALRRGNAVVTANRLHLPALARAAGRWLAIIDC